MMKRLMFTAALAFVAAVQSYGQDTGVVGGSGPIKGPGGDPGAHMKFVLLPIHKSGSGGENVLHFKSLTDFRFTLPPSADLKTIRLIILKGEILHNDGTAERAKRLFVTQTLVKDPKYPDVVMVSPGTAKKAAHLAVPGNTIGLDVRVKEGETADIAVKTVEPATAVKSQWRPAATAASD
jgi:hypothetical protein